MATLYITELQNLGWVGQNSNQLIHAPAVPGLAEQTVAVGGGSLQSNPFNGNTKFIMVESDTTCSLAFGANPTAAATAHRMAANECRFYAVAPGSKIAVIANT